MEDYNYRAIEHCRLCGRRGDVLTQVLDLGDQYVIDFPLAESDPPAVKAPLLVVQCDRCGLAQLGHTVSRDLMYRNYHYRSGTSETMREALRSVVESAVKLVSRTPDAVLDIGSNDGTLLSFYPSLTYRVGVEPSNIPPADTNYVNMVYQGYFSAESFKGTMPPPEMRGLKFDVITSVAMFYDVEDPRGFIADVAELLQEDGVWINQMNYLPLVMESNALDFFSHEHLTHWRLTDLETVLEETGLEAFKVETFQLNGGTARFYIQHKGARAIDPSIFRMRDREREIDPTSPLAWKAFRERIDANGERLRRLLQEMAPVFVRGASTRGNSLLQYYGLGVKDLPMAADRDANKWGKKMVGTNIPIISEAEAWERNPRAFLILPYTYLEQFKARDREYLARGGKHIVPLPEAKVLWLNAF